MVLTFLGCGQPLAFGPDDPFPELLSELGYADANDVHPFEPSWPLWSDGLDKKRWIHLPEGTTIGADFSLPDGTLLIKTFTDGDRPIETRLLRTGDPLEFAAYLWEGDDARLLSLEEAVPIEGLDHEVPRLFDCRMCHEPAGGALGVDAMQWSAETVDDLSKLFEGEPELEPVRGPDPSTTRVLGWYVGNCVGCHNGEVSLQTSFDLRPDVALANTVSVPVETTSGGLRIAPGDPEHSVLYLTVSGLHDDPELRAMPPVGVGVKDAEAIDHLRQWILDL